MGAGNVSDSRITDSSHYKRWVAMRHQGGIQPGWGDFRAFERWRREHDIGPGDRLRRVDTSRPWGPDNIKDIRQETAGVQGSPHYARWINTRVGGGVEPQWDQFREFERRCMDRHVGPGDRLRRIDTSRPWGPDNVERGHPVVGSPYYRRWAAMRNRCGVSPEWDDFRAFEQWCRERHVGPDDQLRRIDRSRPCGPGNVRVAKR